MLRFLRFRKNQGRWRKYFHPSTLDGNTRGQSSRSRADSNQWTVTWPRNRPRRNSREFRSVAPEASNGDNSSTDRGKHVFVDRQLIFTKFCCKTSCQQRSKLKVTWPSFLSMNMLIVNKYEALSWIPTQFYVRIRGDLPFWCLAWRDSLVAIVIVRWNFFRFWKIALIGRNQQIKQPRGKHPLRLSCNFWADCK